MKIKYINYKLLKSVTMLNRLTVQSKTKFPYVNAYIANLEKKQATTESIENEIALLNKVAICRDPSFSEKLTVATAVTLLNPTGPLLGLCAYYGYDNCDTQCREAQLRYNDFASKL